MIAGESAPSLQSFDEQGESRADLAAARIIKVVARRQRAPVLEHFPKIAPGDMRPHQALGHIGQPEPGHSRADYLVGTVEDQLAIDSDIQFALSLCQVP